MIDLAVLRRIAEECERASELMDVGGVRAGLSPIGIRVTATTIITGQRREASDIVTYEELAAWEHASEARTLADRMRVEVMAGSSVYRAQGQDREAWVKY